MSSEHDGDIAVTSQHGYRMLRENRLDDAVTAFRTVLESDPANCYALVGLGDVARKRHDYADAADLYQTCLESEPRNTYALFGLADSYRSLKQFAKSLEIWERYLSEDDSNVTVLTRVADVYRKVRNYDRSVELYQRVLSLEHDNAYALIGLGHVHYDFREYERALSYWMRMHEIAGSDVDIRVLTSIGNCYRKLKRFSDGLGFFSDALEREPDNFYALFGLADCHRGLNEPGESLQYWTRILESDPENKVILTRAGDAQRAMGNLDVATELYHRALSIGFDVYATLGLALISRRQGEPEAAVQSLASLAESEPRNPRVHQELAQAYIQMDEPEEARRVLHSFKRTGIHNAYLDELLSRLGEN